MLGAGLRSTTGPEVLNLFIQGSQSSSGFQTFTGLSISESETQLARLIKLGIVVTSPGEPGWLEAELPTWSSFEILGTAATTSPTPEIRR